MGNDNIKCTFTNKFLSHSVSGKLLAEQTLSGSSLQKLESTLVRNLSSYWRGFGVAPVCTLDICFVGVVGEHFRS